MTKTAKENKDNIKGIIIDLRNNNEGLITNIYKLCEPFVGANSVLFTMKMKNGESKITSANGGKLVGIPIKLLVNNQTTSGAELFCHIIKMKCNAQIIGIKTYGNGNIYYFQSIDTEKYSMKFRGGELFLLDGRPLNNNGIIPDIEYDKDDILEYVKR